ncbi:MAG: hypothetical protein WBP22_05490 [Candidatus Saccharimonas sp.]
MDFSPVTFLENQPFYDELSKQYIQHDRGLFILAPSGAGKSYYCKNQSSQHWIDGDILWNTSGAHPDTQWWLGGEEVIHRVDQRSDVVTMEAKRQGFWIMGASNYWLKPDAIVIPEWDIHVAYIKEREENHYDGGAKSDALEQVKSHIEFIKKWHTDYDVPFFTSIEAAVSALAGSEPLPKS